MELLRPIKMLGLSLTGQCNLACRYCYADAHSKAQMTLETARKAIDLAASSGEPFTVQFTGGEPLMAWDILKSAATYVRQQNMPAILQVQSNGTLVKEEVADFLKKYRIGVGISLDGRPEINDRTRYWQDGTGASLQILAGIQKLAERGIEIGITCTVTSENVTALSGMVEMAFYLGNVRRLGFDLLHDQGKGNRMVALHSESVKAGIREAVKTAGKLEKMTGKRLLFSQSEQVEKQMLESNCGFSHCHAMKGEAIFVDAQGALYPCASLVGDKTYCVGHVDTGIDNERQNQIMACIESRMAECKTCADFDLCGGGCYARWIGTGEAAGKHEAECALKRAFIQNWRTL